MKHLLPFLLVCISILSYNNTKAQFVLTVNVVDCSAPTLCDGSASLDSLNNPMTTIDWYLNGVLIQSGGTYIGNLCPGNYTVITTGNGVTMTSPFTIGVGTPNPCSGFTTTIAYGLMSGPTTCDGWVSAIASGGTAPYTYWWSTLSMASSLYNLCTGNYTVNITDANGCTTSASQAIYYDTTNTNPCAGFSASVAVTDCSAPGVCDGELTALMNSGTSPFMVSWSNAATTYTISNLCSGSYDATITDAMGCSVNISEFVGYNNGNFDSINVIGNLATGANITGTLLSNWVYNCDIELSMLDTAYMVTATFGNNPANQDSLYTTWYLVDTSGAFTYVNYTFYVPGAVGTYNLVLQVYCPIKSTPLYYQIISQFDVQSAGITAEPTLSIQISPNPAQDYLTLIGLDSGTYQIFDFTGKCIQHGCLEKQIDIKQLDNGSYFLNVNGKVLPFLKMYQ